MSRPKSQPPQPAVSGPDGATPVGPMTLTGVVRTSKGFAVATATKNGDEWKVTLGHSQAWRQYVAAEHKRAVMAQAMKA